MRLSSPTHRRATVAVVALISLTGCGGDDPDPIPSASSTSPSVSPAPANAPSLTAAQKADYKAAAAKYAEYIDLANRVGTNPKAGPEVAEELAEVATDPLFAEFSDGLERLIKNDAHTEGERKFEWISPVSVTPTEVVFLQCESPGDRVLVKGHERAPQHGNTLSKVTVVNSKGSWFVRDDEGRAAGC